MPFFLSIDSAGVYPDEIVFKNVSIRFITLNWLLAVDRRKTKGRPFETTCSMWNINELQEKGPGLVQENWKGFKVVAPGEKEKGLQV